VDLVLQEPKLAPTFNKSKTSMDRHHLLSLLDKLQEKYVIQDGEYKEFAEAIGGKKKPIEFNEGDLIKVTLDRIEASVDCDYEDITPSIYVNERCSFIWKVVPDEHEYHSGESISHKYLNNCQMNKSAMDKIVKDHCQGDFTMMTMDKNNRKYCIRVISVEPI
jgi:hypothetical protein